MTDTKSLFKIAGIFGAAALTLSLASCSGGQSVADACKIAQDSMTDVVAQSQTDAQSALQSAMSGEETDFAAIFTPVVDALEDTQGKVTNEDVKGPLDNFVTEYKSFVETFDGIDLSAMQEIQEMSQLDMTDPANQAKLEELQTKSKELQQQSQELQTKLQDSQSTLMDASSELNDVCSAG